MTTDANVAGAWVRRSAMRTALRACALLTLIVVGMLAVAAAPLPFVPTIATQLALIGAILLVEKRFSPLVERKARGASAEERVGEILDGVPGWHVIHDVDTGRGNIDHVVIGPGGIFTVETKAWRGFFDADRADVSRWWSQAYAQSKFLEPLAARRVEPLVVVVGARTKRALARKRGVLVMPERLLAGHLERRDAVLDAEAVDALHGRLTAALRPAPRDRAAA